MGFLNSSTSWWQTVCCRHVTEKTSTRLQSPTLWLSVKVDRRHIPAFRVSEICYLYSLSQKAAARYRPWKWRGKPRKSPGVWDTGSRSRERWGESPAWGWREVSRWQLFSRPRKQALETGADQKTWRCFFKKTNLMPYLMCINILKVLYN